MTGIMPSLASANPALRWLRQLDRILRGEATKLSELRSGRIEIPAAGLSIVIICLGMIYGLCMGCFALTGSGNNAPMQLVASMVKVPLLFFLTLIVTLPSLYVFNALVGSRLSLVSVLRLLIAALGVMLAVLASMGTIVAFFSFSTTSYNFMLLLNVVIFTVAGVLGLIFLLQTLHRLSVAAHRLDEPTVEPPSPESPPVIETEPSESPPPLPPYVPVKPQAALDRIAPHVLGRHVTTVFRIWIIVFGLVGAQMAWVLRPFVGHPTLPFQWFRARESNFFQAVWTALSQLMGMSS